MDTWDRNETLCFPYPEDFSGDVGNPVFFECVPFGVLHKVCDGPSPTKLHNKLQGRQERWKQSQTRLHTHSKQNTQPSRRLPWIPRHRHNHVGSIQVVTVALQRVYPLWSLRWECIHTVQETLTHISGWQMMCFFPSSNRGYFAGYHCQTNRNQYFRSSSLRWFSNYWIIFPMVLLRNYIVLNIYEIYIWIKYVNIYIWNR